MNDPQASPLSLDWLVDRVLREYGGAALGTPADADPADYRERVALVCQSALGVAVCEAAGMPEGAATGDGYDTPAFKFAKGLVKERLAAAPARGPRSLDDLLAGLRSDDSERRADATYDLGELPPEVSVPLWKALATDLDVYVAINAIQGLNEVGARECAEQMGRLAVESPHHLVRTNAILAAAELGGATVLPWLVQAASHADPFIRHDAARYLGEFGGAGELPVLERLLKDRVLPETFDEDGLPESEAEDRICDQAKRAVGRIKKRLQRKPPEKPH